MIDLEKYTCVELEAMYNVMLKRVGRLKAEKKLVTDYIHETEDKELKELDRQHAITLIRDIQETESIIEDIESEIIEVKYFDRVEE